MSDQVVIVLGQGILLVVWAQLWVMTHQLHVLWVIASVEWLTCERVVKPLETHRTDPRVLTRGEGRTILEFGNSLGHGHHALGSAECPAAFAAESSRAYLAELFHDDGIKRRIVVDSIARLVCPGRVYVDVSE